MTDGRLDELERLANAATPGPWAVYDDNPRKWPVIQYEPEGPGNDCGGFEVRGIYCPRASADAAFIAAARTALPELIAEVRRLWEGFDREGLRGDPMA